MKPIGVAIIGCGGIALANHVPGLALCPQARLVALCDHQPEVLARAAAATGITQATLNYDDVLRRDDVHAVIVATPNHVHATIVLAAIRAGKHVLCEKPLAMNYAEALAMYQAAEAAHVRHMTAFTYRFVPAMRYLSTLVSSGAIGRPYHFRAQRFQDWGDRGLGWRQVARLAGTGELGDMLSHRIDFGHLLMGPILRLSAQRKQFLAERQGQAADVEDWVAMMAEFSNGATGVWESSKLCSGRGEGGRSHDYCEVNGSEGTLIYRLGSPQTIEVGQAGQPGLRTEPVPPSLLKWPNSPRDPAQGDPLVTFRYDQDVEFINAILEQRPCQPSFREGCQTQAVMDAALQSAAEQRGIELANL